MFSNLIQTQVLDIMILIKQSIKLNLRAELLTSTVKLHHIEDQKKISLDQDTTMVISMHLDQKSHTKWTLEINMFSNRIETHHQVLMISIQDTT